MRLADPDARVRVGRIETLLQQLETLDDERAHGLAFDIVQTLLELYGEGLARIIDLVATTGEPAQLEALAADELVSHLLLIHGLHPTDLETRVRGALDTVRPYLASHGGDVALVDIENGVAHLQLQGSCNGCVSSTATLKTAIEEALQAAAPDLEGIEAEGVAEADPGVQPLIFCPDGLKSLKQGAAP